MSKQDPHKGGPCLRLFLSFSMFSEGSGSKEENCRRASLKVERERKVGERSKHDSCARVCSWLFWARQLCLAFWFLVLRESVRWGEGNVKIEERKIWNAFT